MLEAFPLPVMSSHCQKTFPLLVKKEIEHSNPTLAKIPILDTIKFEQWKFRIQQYLQKEHYALWEVIEFSDSYEAPKDDAPTGSASEGSAKKKGKTVTVTTEDMQKMRNDIKARTTLLLALSDEHQLRFSKYKPAQDLWAAILKTFGGNEATRKTKKNLLKQQYAKNSSGNGEVNTTSIPTASTQVSPASANVAAAIISFDTACAYIASQSNGSQIKSQDRGRRENFKQDSKVEEQAPKALMAIDEVRWDWRYMANEEENHALVADEEAPTEFALIAKFSSDNEVEAKLVEFKNQEIKFCEKIRSLEFKVESKTNRIENLTNELEMLNKEKEGLDSKLIGFQSASKDLDNLIGSQRSDKNKEGLGYSVVPSPPTQVYSLPKKDMSWTVLPKFADDTITDYTRPSPSIESNPNDLQNNSSSEIGESTSGILSKPKIKFVKAADSPTVIKTNKDETIRKPSIKYVELYRKTSKSSNVKVRTQSKVPRVPTVNRKFPTVNRKFPTGNLKVSTADLGNRRKAVKALACWIWKPRQNSSDKGQNSNSDSGCSRHMTGNISYLSDYEPYDGGYVSFGQGGCKITGKGTIKTEMNDFCSRKGIKREFSNARTPQQNGVAERRNRTLIEAPRTMLADVKLPVTFWAEAVNTACYVQNRVEQAMRGSAKGKHSIYTTFVSHIVFGWVIGNSSNGVFLEYS
nr:ribonuclease H-like domain-containing protein [Tanacetum cinerariifolium]